MVWKRSTMRIGAAMMSKLISGTVVVLTGLFSAAFALLLVAFFPSINSPMGFFQSANALFYLTIQGMFLGLIMYAGYVSVRRREQKF
jgi:hypothetical protein